MTEGMMELTRNIGIAAAICGLTGWMMSVSGRYRQAPTRGLMVGFGFGFASLAPMLFLLPLYLYPELPFWVDKAWLGATLAYEGILGFAFFRHRLDAPAKVPAKESLRVAYPAMGLLKSDISPAA